MEKSALIGLAGCLLAFAGAQAQDGTSPPPDRTADVKASLLNAIPGFYISPLLSGALLTGEAELNGDSVDFDGYYVRGGMALGYQYEDIRLEVESSVGYAETESDLPDMLAPFVEDDEKIVFVTLTGSLFYDFPPILEREAFGQPFNVRPYVGTGAGVLYADFDELDDDATGMIGQGMAGIGLRLTPRTHLDIGYRLVYLPRLKPGDTDIEATFHTGEIKLRYRF
jgi:opacity protein-like surface antigen